MKWGFIPQGPDGPGAKPKYLVINADEGEITGRFEGMSGEQIQ